MPRNPFRPSSTGHVQQQEFPDAGSPSIEMRLHWSWFFHNNQAGSTALEARPHWSYCITKSAKRLVKEILLELWMTCMLHEHTTKSFIFFRSSSRRRWAFEAIRLVGCRLLRSTGQLGVKPAQDPSNSGDMSLGAQRELHEAPAFTSQTSFEILLNNIPHPARTRGASGVLRASTWPMLPAQYRPHRRGVLPAALLTKSITSFPPLPPATTSKSVAKNAPSLWRFAPPRILASLTSAGCDLPPDTDVFDSLLVLSVECLLGHTTSIAGAAVVVVPPRGLDIRDCIRKLRNAGGMHFWAVAIPASAECWTEAACHSLFHKLPGLVIAAIQPQGSRLIRKYSDKYGRAAFEIDPLYCGRRYVRQSCPYWIRWCKRA